jgi:hypothetical protein
MIWMVLMLTSSTILGSRRRRVERVFRDFAEEVESNHQEPKEGHQKVLLVPRRGYVGDVLMGLEDATWSP